MIRLDSVGNAACTLPACRLPTQRSQPMGLGARERGDGDPRYNEHGFADSGISVGRQNCSRRRSFVAQQQEHHHQDGSISCCATGHNNRLLGEKIRSQAAQLADLTERFIQQEAYSRLVEARLLQLDASHTLPVTPQLLEGGGGECSQARQGRSLSARKNGSTTRRYVGTVRCATPVEELLLS